MTVEDNPVSVPDLLSTILFIHGYGFGEGKPVQHRSADSACRTGWLANQRGACMSLGNRSVQPLLRKGEGLRVTGIAWCLVLAFVVFGTARGEVENASVASESGQAEQGKPQKAQTEESKPALRGTIRDLVFFGVKRHLVLRFEVFIDHQPLDERYAESIEQSFEYWDLNSDGQLSDKETSGAPWRNQVMKKPEQLILEHVATGKRQQGSGSWPVT